MEILIMDRRQGKTTKLIEMARDAGGVVVTFNSQRAKQIKEEFKELLGDTEVVSFNALFGMHERGKSKVGVEYFFDDMDLILDSLFHVKVGGMTINANDDTVVRTGEL